MPCNLCAIFDGTRNRRRDRQPRASLPPRLAEEPSRLPGPVGAQSTHYIFAEAVSGGRSAYTVEPPPPAAFIRSRSLAKERKDKKEDAKQPTTDPKQKKKAATPASKYIPGTPVIIPRWTPLP